MISKFELCPLQKRPDYLSGLGTSTWHTLVHGQEKLYTIMHWPLHYWSYTASKHMEETSLLDTGLFSHISRKLQAISTKAGSGDVQMLYLSWIDTCSGDVLLPREACSGLSHSLNWENLDQERKQNFCISGSIIMEPNQVTSENWPRVLFNRILRSRTIRRIRRSN